MPRTKNKWSRLQKKSIDEGGDYSVPDFTPEDELAAQFELFKQLMKENVFDEADTSRQTRRRTCAIQTSRSTVQ